MATKNYPSNALLIYLIIIDFNTLFLICCSFTINIISTKTHTDFAKIVIFLSNKQQSEGRK